MSDIIPFEEYARQRGGDDARFLGCKFCENPEFSVIVRFKSGQPFIASLICAECGPESEASVVMGMIDVGAEVQADLPVAAALAAALGDSAETQLRAANAEIDQINGHLTTADRLLLEVKIALHRALRAHKWIALGALIAGVLLGWFSHL